MTDDYFGLLSNHSPFYPVICGGFVEILRNCNNLLADYDISDEEPSCNGTLVDTSNPASTVKLRNSAATVLKDRELRALISKSVHGNIW